MLKLNHVSKTFNIGTVNERKAIVDLSLDVKEGDFITIIGSNGAGKSTLFNIISGYYLTEEGSITLDDMDITLMPDHKRARYIGRLFQDPMLGSAPGMTIEENLSLLKVKADGSVKCPERTERNSGNVFPSLIWALKIA